LRVRTRQLQRLLRIKQAVPLAALYLKLNSDVEEGFELFLMSSGTAVTPLSSSDILVSNNPNKLAANAEAAAEELRIMSEYSDVLREELPEGLPPVRSVQHSIELKPGSSPRFIPPHRMSEAELEALKKYIDTMLKLGHIRISVSPHGSPVLFVKKKDGSLRLCVRGLPRAQQHDHPQQLRSAAHRRHDGSSVEGEDVLQDRSRLVSAYGQMRVNPADIPKTAFNCRYGHFEYTVLPFGLCNAPASFCQLMNNILHPLLDKSVISYIDDILVYSNSLEEHKVHVREVMDLLREHKLYAKQSKCDLFKEEVQFLGHIVSARGIRMEDDKIRSVTAWPIPTSAGDIRQFLGLAGFYRKYIKSFSNIAGPLTDLLHKDKSFEWTAVEQQAFDHLKLALTTAPVLALPDTSKSAPPFVVHCDASGYAVGACLMQDSGQGLQPIAFLSKRMNKAEMNDDIRDQEFLAIILAVNEWNGSITCTASTSPLSPITARCSSSRRSRRCRSGTCDGCKGWQNSIRKSFTAKAPRTWWQMHCLGVQITSLLKRRCRSRCSKQQLQQGRPTLCLYRRRWTALILSVRSSKHMHAIA
jgi:hypothetical protein